MRVASMETDAVERAGTPRRVIAICVLAAIAFVLAIATFAFFNYIAGNVVIASMDIPYDKVISSSSLDITVNLKNSGLLTGRRHIVLLLDGEEYIWQDVIVNGRSSLPIRFNISQLSIGEHTVRCGNCSEEITVLKPAEFAVSNLTLPDSPILVNRDFTVYADITNNGDVKGVYTAEFELNDMVVEGIPVEVNPEETKRIAQTLNTGERGENHVYLGSESKTFLAYTPADIQSVSIVLSKLYAKMNENAKITVEMENDGDIAGTYHLELLKNGEIFKEEDIEVEGNSSIDDDFTFSSANTGTYTFNADNAQAILQIVKPSRPANGTYLYGKPEAYSSTDLVIKNNYSQDILIFVYNSEPFSFSYDHELMYIIYVRGNSSCNIRDIASSCYYVCYEMGADYSSQKKGFITNPTYYMFDDYLYTFKGADFWTQYTWTLTLKPSKPGNASVSQIDERDFPGR